MDPIKKGREHLNNSAQMMLNLSIGFVKDADVSSPQVIQEYLKDAIASVSHVGSNGDAADRSLQMQRNFENTIRLMKNKEIDLTKESMISVFRKSLDNEALSALDVSLNSENKKIVEQSMEVVDSTKKQKGFDGGGLSL